MHRATLLCAVLLSSLTMAASAPARTPDPGGTAAITIVANDFGFELPDRIPAGVATFRLVNQGAVLHHAQLALVKEGRTVDDVSAALAAGALPDFVVWTGGPGLVAPGGESTVTLNLRAGTYVWICFVVSPGDHAPHLAKGMVRPMIVEGGARGELPEADNTLMLNDYDFKLGRELTSGPQVLRVRNYAAQPHEVIFVRLAPGKSAQDLLDWLMAGEQGPPPGMPIGGMQALSQGMAANVELDITPGEYALLCFIPDAKDGQPHVAHGMVKQVTVR